MSKRSLCLATLAIAGAAATFSTPADAGDPVAGMLIGGGIGAAIGGPPGAAVGAVIGTIAAASDPYDYRHGRYYDRGYYDRGYYAPPVAYAAPPRVAYYEPYYGPRAGYYAPRIEYRSYRRYDDRHYRGERHYQRDEYDRR